jgi:hypothetical protein
MVAHARIGMINAFQHDGGRVDPHLAPGDDPLRQLESWGRRADRRARRRHVVRQLWRALTWPVRAPWYAMRYLRRHLGLALTLLVLLSLGAAYAFDLTHKAHPATASGTAPTNPATSSTPGRPFDSTPAAHWAEGAAGIIMPPAETVNGFSEATVAADLDIVRRALIAARLDPRMLVDHDPSTLVSLFAPSSRSAFTRILGGPSPVVTRLSSGARLGPYQPRVSGDTAFTVARNKDGLLALTIETNYVWAYAFENGRVAVIHDDVEWFFFRSEDVAPADVGLLGMGITEYVLDADCALFNGQGLLAPASAGPSDPLAYWSPEQDIITRTSCSVMSTVDSTPTLGA